MNPVRRLLPRPAPALALALAAILAAPAAAQTGSGTATEDDPYRIMLILWRGCEDACRGFKDYFEMRDRPVEFIERDVATDASLIPGLVEEAEMTDIDLVLTWGTTVTLQAVGTYDAVDPERHITDIPVVFMIVTDPVGAKVVEDVAGSGRNVTGTQVVVPEDVQMRAIQSYRPFDRLGVVYNTDEVNAVVSVEKLRPVAEAMGFELLTREVPLDAEGKPDPAALPGLVQELAAEGADYLYIGSSSFILVHRDLFTNAAIEAGIPVAAAGEVSVVESNALMGLVSRYYNVGSLTAAKAEEILFEGRDPGEIPIEGLSRYSLIVNMEAAHRLALYPPLGLLRFAEIIKAGEPPH